MGQVCTTETSWIHDGWSPDEWNDGWSLDERNDDWSGVRWHEDCEQTYNTSVGSFSLESSEWANTNLDTGAALNAFLVNYDPEGVGDGRFYRTASGEWIPDGEAWQFQGYDENGLPRSLNGRLTCVHKSVVQRCRDRVQRTTRFLPGTRWWLHDPDSQQN